MPGNQRGSVTPKIHNRGGWQDRSPFTSWSFSFAVAEEHASVEPGGVVLRLPYNDQTSTEWRWVESPDMFDEKEILLEGARIDAEVVLHG